MFVLLVPALLPALWVISRTRYLRRLLLLLGLFGISFLFFLKIITPYPWWFKYVMWFPGIVAVGYGGLLAKFPKHGLKSLSLAMFVIPIVIASGFGGAFVDKDRFKAFLKMPVSMNATAVYGNCMPSPNPFAVIYKMSDVRSIGYYYEDADNFIYPLFDNQYQRQVHLYTGDTAAREQISEFIHNEQIDVFYTNDKPLADLLKTLGGLEEVESNVFKRKTQ